MSFSYVWREYSRELIYGFILLMLAGISIWLGTYIPEDLYVNGITQIMNGCIAYHLLSRRLADGTSYRRDEDP